MDKPTIEQLDTDPNWVEIPSPFKLYANLLPPYKRVGRIKKPDGTEAVVDKYIPRFAVPDGTGPFGPVLREVKGVGRFLRGIAAFVVQLGPLRLAKLVPGLNLPATVLAALEGLSKAASDEERMAAVVLNLGSERARETWPVIVEAFKDGKGLSRDEILRILAKMQGVTL